MINNNKTTISKFFENKTKIIRNTPNSNNILDAEVIALLKSLSNFWRSLDFLLMNCEIKLDLRWTKKFVICKTSKTSRAVDSILKPLCIMCQQWQIE